MDRGAFVSNCRHTHAHTHKHAWTRFEFVLIDMMAMQIGAADATVNRVLERSMSFVTVCFLCPPAIFLSLGCVSVGAT